MGVCIKIFKSEQKSFLNVCLRWPQCGCGRAGKTRLEGGVGGPPPPHTHALPFSSTFYLFSFYFYFLPFLLVKHLFLFLFYFWGSPHFTAFFFPPFRLQHSPTLFILDPFSFNLLAFLFYVCFSCPEMAILLSQVTIQASDKNESKAKQISLFICFKKEQRQGRTRNEE